MDVQIEMSWKEIIKTHKHGYTFKLKYAIPQELWDKIQDLIEKEIKEDIKIGKKK